MTELAPREKLTLLGAEALSDAELLAIFYAPARAATASWGWRG